MALSLSISCVLKWSKADFASLKKPRYRIDQNVRTIKEPIIQCISIGGYYYVPMLTCIIFGTLRYTIITWQHTINLTCASVRWWFHFVLCHRIRAQFNIRCRFHWSTARSPHSLVFLLSLCRTVYCVGRFCFCAQPIISDSLHNNIILRFVK